MFCGLSSLRFVFVVVCVLVAAVPLAAGDFRELADALRLLDSSVLSEAEREAAVSAIGENQRRRLGEANVSSSRAWREVDGREAWEEFLEPRIAALRRSLGQFPERSDELNLRVTGVIEGDGFRVENTLFESRPGFWVSANLYVPGMSGRAVSSAEGEGGLLPGIIICHSHHRPKEHGELQDMGMTWARAGCLVLVLDQLGHGERAEHPFRTAADYQGEFQVSRQDYYYRYDNGVQLHLAGESLIGWMAWDIMRGVDLLLRRPGIDRERIILLGSVAGGGDPCAVAAAIDDRIACAVPFNFGGPQPETRFPLPEDSETSFNYAGSGSWESTRNLRMSAQDGFLPWVIVGSLAPRRLVFAHEFSWDRVRDPVWKRLEAIYGFYGVEDRLAFTHGRGELRGQPPEATHCTHIGRPHRVLIHEAFRGWFGIEVDPDQDEYSSRLETELLRCWTAESREELQPRSLRDILAQLASERIEAARRDRLQLPVQERGAQLRRQWQAVLGEEFSYQLAARGDRVDRLPGEAEVHRFACFCAETGSAVPLLLLLPQRRAGGIRSAVVCVAQEGKEGFLNHRANEIAELLSAGVAVCLPDLSGTGEVRASSDRGRYSVDTSRSSTEWMLGGTTVGSRLSDLRAVIDFVRARVESSGELRVGLWGDSFALPNSPDTSFLVPQRVEGMPLQSEPLGGVLVLLAAMSDADIAAVCVQGGCTGYLTTLDHWQVFIPHDSVIPGVLTFGDLNDVAASLAPRPLQLVGLVDGRNQRVATEEVRRVFESAIVSYRDAGQPENLVLRDTPESLAGWMIKQLGR